MTILIFKLKNSKQVIYTVDANQQLAGCQVMPTDLGMVQLPWAMMPLGANSTGQDIHYKQEIIRELAKKGLDYRLKLQKEPTLSARAEVLKVLEPINLKIKTANEKLPDNEKSQTLELAWAQFVDVETK